MHLPYSASATSRWLACPASVKAAEGMPEIDDSTEYAEEGTELHAFGALAITTNVPPEDKTVLVYYEYIQYIRATYSPIVESIEQLVAHATYPAFGGTADYSALYYDLDGKLTLHVIDFKAGIGTIVDVTDNKQLLTYAACIASHLPYAEIEKYRLTIVQPRSYREGDEITTIDCTEADIARHMREVATAFSQDHFATGQHCRYCPCRTTCVALSDDMFRVTQLDTSDPQPTDQTVDKWLHLLSLRSVIGLTLDKVEERLIQRAREGLPVPGHKVVETRSHRYWEAETDKVLLVLDMLGIKDAFTEPKLLSPAQIESIPVEGMTKKEVKESLQSLVAQRVSGVKLVLETASGKPVEFGSEFPPVTKEDLV